MTPFAQLSSTAVPSGAESARARTRVRRWQAKAAPFQASALVFALACVGIVGVAYTLDRNTRHSTSQQATTELAGGARVAASTFAVLRANLRARAGQIAASLDLQRAVIANDRAALQQLADSRNARIAIGGRVYGSLPAAPRLASTALIAGNGRVLARVTIAVAMGNQLLKLLRDETPLRPAAALMLVRNERVVAGGPLGAKVSTVHGRVTFRSVDFQAQQAPLGFAKISVVAVEQVRAIQAAALPARRRLLFASLITLGLAAALALRLGRPVARLLNDVSRLSRQAQTDALTGLANRRSLEERLTEELARAAVHQTSLACVLADIDNFKAVNDQYGHQSGDAVLRAVAQAFGQSVREVDVAGRYGGEEFALLLPGSSLAAGRRVAERVRQSVASTVVATPNGDQLRVTVSFGVAAYPASADAESLLTAADEALYRAKRAGKNRVVIDAATDLYAVAEPEVPEPAPVASLQA